MHGLISGFWRYIFFGFTSFGYFYIATNSEKCTKCQMIFYDVLNCLIRHFVLGVDH